MPADTDTPETTDLICNPAGCFEGEVFRPGKILTTMPALRADIGAIATTDQADTGKFKFNYRKIERIIKALAPLLTKHKITTSTRIDPASHSLQRFERKSSNGIKTTVHAKVTCTVYWIADDGSFVTSCGAGEGMDNIADFASDKAMSYAVKQAIIYGLMIPTENMPDPHGNDNIGDDDESSVVITAKRMLADANTTESVTALGNRFSANSKGSFSDDEKKLLVMMAETKLDQLSKA